MTKKSKNQDLKRGYLYLVLITIVVIVLLAITCDGEPVRPLPKKKFVKTTLINYYIEMDRIVLADS